MQGDVQAANIYPQLEGIGGGHCPQLPIMQGCLNFPPLLQQSESSMPMWPCTWTVASSQQDPTFSVYCLLT